MFLLMAASASGYALHEISLSDAIPYGRLKLMLHPIREVSGTVTDPQGRSVAGAKVRGRRVGQARHIHLDQYRESVTESEVSFTIRVPGGSEQYRQVHFLQTAGPVYIRGRRPIPFLGRLAGVEDAQTWYRPLPANTSEMQLRSALSVGAVNSMTT